MKEKRQTTRFPYKRSVRLRLAPHQYAACQMLNLSMQGFSARFPGNLRPKVGCRIRFCVRLSAGSRPVSLSGRAVLERCDSRGGAGFRFDGLSADALTLLRRIVEFNLGQDRTVRKQLKALTARAYGTAD
ncbi:MAG: PilZ domain-containing protein [Candidatus Omnitrophota bacterium]